MTFGRTYLINSGARATSTYLTLILISIIILLYLLILKSKEVDRLRQILQGTIKKVALETHVCLHNFGYLKSYPKGRPIPSECMGCSDILECLSHREKKPKTTKKKPGKRKKVTKTARKKKR